MGNWIIEYWVDASGKRSVKKWLEALTKEQLEFVTKELSLLELCGNDLRLPHSRSLGKGIFELRERRFGYRIYYGFYRERIIILLEAGDKGTQKNDINIARKRFAMLTNVKEL